MTYQNYATQPPAVDRSKGANSGLSAPCVPQARPTIEGLAHYVQYISSSRHPVVPVPLRGMLDSKLSREPLLLVSLPAAWAPHPCAGRTHIHERADLETRPRARRAHQHAVPRAGRDPAGDGGRPFCAPHSANPAGSRYARPCDCEHRCAGPYACTRRVRRTAPRTLDLRVHNKNSVRKEDP